MDHKTYQPKMPDIMEAIFDAVYLLFGVCPKFCVNTEMRCK